MAQRYWICNLYFFPELIHADQRSRDLSDESDIEQTKLDELESNSGFCTSFSNHKSVRRASYVYCHPKALLSVPSPSPTPIQTRSNQLSINRALGSKMPLTSTQRNEIMIIEMMTTWIREMEIQDDLATSSRWSEPNVEKVNYVIEGYSAGSKSRIEVIVSDSDATSVESATNHLKNSRYDELQIHPKRMKKMIRKQRQKQNKLLGRLGLLSTRDE
jgi:hypothetical protein